MDHQDVAEGGTAAASTASFSFGPGLFSDADTQSTLGSKPNILVIKVDQLRFPTVFPTGIGDPGEFLRHTMPNLHQLWTHGVKFASHYTAACACTPARGTIISGLYSQQSWLVQTILAKPGTPVSPQPPLNPSFPTYGTLLQKAGYRTPYVGKWHVSIPENRPHPLEIYGFDGLSYPDPTGANLQGAYGDEKDGYHNDRHIASQAVQWLRQHGSEAAPWCLTVSFINPHDKEFFWAGTEFKTYNLMFPPHQEAKPFTYYSYSPFRPKYDKEPLVPWDRNDFKDPPSLKYPNVPDNWETAKQIAAHKPSTQFYSRFFQELVWGGAADATSQSEFAVKPYPPAPYDRIPGDPLGIGVAPFSYWKRSLDSYTQAMTAVDKDIGHVMHAFESLTAEARNNTVIVFMSDHGEYAGAHGFLSGKVGSLYEEAFHVPLIVVDPSGRFTGDLKVLRHGLSSSVDILPLLVSLGHGGSRDWLVGDLEKIYGERHDLLPMLRSSQAPGRRYVLLASDEAVPGFYNFNKSPTHIVGMRTADAKIGLYTNWVRNTAQIEDDHTLETEFYDYSTPGGQAEMKSTTDDPRVPMLKNELLTDLIPNVLRAELPGALSSAQSLSRDAYLIYDKLIREAEPPGDGDSHGSDIRGVLPFGEDF